MILPMMVLPNMILSCHDSAGLLRSHNKPSEPARTLTADVADSADKEDYRPNPGLICSGCGFAAL